MQITPAFGVEPVTYYMGHVDPTTCLLGAGVSTDSSAVQTDQAVQALDSNPYG